ncbi:MAG: hypothetical protein ABI591_01955 [Kofleriaceae bacterium]
MRTLVVCLVVACSHPPPPRPVAAERPVTGFADIADEWVTSDDLDWGYFLKVQADGDLFLTVDRGKLGRCSQHATLIRGSTGPKLELEVVFDQCHRERAAGPLFVSFPSYTGTTLTVEELDGDRRERRTYTRAKHVCQDQCSNE